MKELFWSMSFTKSTKLMPHNINETTVIFFKNIFKFFPSSSWGHDFSRKDPKTSLIYINHKIMASMNTSIIDSSVFEPTLMIKRHSHSVNNQIRQLPRQTLPLLHHFVHNFLQTKIRRSKCYATLIIFLCGWEYIILKIKSPFLKFKSWTIFVHKKHFITFY